MDKRKNRAPIQRAHWSNSTALSICLPVVSETEAPLLNAYYPYASPVTLNPITLSHGG